jgi:hypothetical protein
MPLLAWVAFAGLIFFFGFRLVREARTGSAKYGPLEFPRNTNVGSFWFFVTIDLLCFLFFSGFLLLIVKVQFF